MAVVYPNTIIRYNELPEINGELIDAIYSQKWDEEFNKSRDCYSDEEPDFYLCTSYFRLHSGRNLRLFKLPEGLQKIFDGVQIGDKTVRASYMSFRTSGSGNGSFTDDSFYLRGKGSEYHSYYRGSDDKAGVPTNSEFPQLVLASLNQKYTCEEVPEYDMRNLPHSTFRVEGGQTYPDKQVEGWRRIFDMPFVALDSKRNDMRVYNDLIKAHVYLTRAYPKKGDAELVKVKIQDANFCFISSWASYKEGDGNQMIRHTVESKYRNGEGFKVRAMSNGKKQHTCHGDNYDLYRVTRISFS
jgi:hypothetical protein